MIKYIKFLFFMLFFAGKSIEHCQKAYVRLKQRVFQGRRPFSSKPLEDFLIEEFGESRKMSTIEYPRFVSFRLIWDSSR